MDTVSLDCSAQFHDACAAHDLNLDHKALSDVLDSLAKELATSHDLRELTGVQSPQLWTDLRQQWRSIAESPSPCLDDGELRDLCVSLAKFTRNLVAGVPANQAAAFENEPDIRLLLHYYTSWSAIQNPDSFAVSRVLTQTLSNLVTANESLVSELWETYMTLLEDQVVVIRLLASPDHRTVLAVLVFILNCIHGSKERLLKLCSTKIGTRICVSLLDKMVELYDAEEPSDGARAFDIGYDIFTRIIEAGLIPSLFPKLSVDDEIITPAQTTLLKLVDSYLQTSRPESPTTQITIREQLSPMLSTSFFAMSAYAQQAIQRALSPPTQLSESGETPPVRRVSARRRRKSSKTGEFEDTSVWFEESPNVSDSEEFSESTSPGKCEMASELEESLQFPTELDVLLPKVCEAEVLITQCIVTIVLEEEEVGYGDGENLKAGFNKSFSEDGKGLIESLVELLHLLDLFLPRINFGKPVMPASQHEDQQAPPPVDDVGFSYLKRDLVRLLGILCEGDQAVQNRVRECGGIPVVMNLCVVDERNPYLREHAIFALHNLLEGNQKNQAVVEAIGPSGSRNVRLPSKARSSF